MVLCSVNVLIAAQADQPRKLLEPIDAPNDVVRLFVGYDLAGQAVKLVLGHDCATRLIPAM